MPDPTNLINITNTNVIPDDLESMPDPTNFTSVTNANATVDYLPKSEGTILQSPATAKDDLIDILTSLTPADLAGPTGPAGPAGSAIPASPTNPTSPTDLFPQEGNTLHHLIWDSCYAAKRKLAKKAPDGTPNSWKDVLRSPEKDLWIKALFKEFEQLLDTKVF
ncbi:hypothetical protein UVI_02063960 [Ustilaginoidea virens]|uniref:Uncharacterized protein n=1 Tax=Ustilaginoidea virens TaxID=1159556 RepID=A0A1B5V9Q2_USTVR|nr:hypothetical protein UVI_02063960 [Ustilaginoidea virens]